MDIDGEEGEGLFVLQLMHTEITNFLLLVLLLLRFNIIRGRRNRCQVRRHYSLLSKIPKQIEYIKGLISCDEKSCIDVLRLGRVPFRKLCYVLEVRGGLRSTRGVSVHEQVAMFLSIIGHHQKIRVVNKSFKRSTRTVSVHFSRVLNAVIRCNDVFLVAPEAVDADSADDKWKWFKGCLGALDGTYIPVKVAASEQARYRSRKSVCSVNMLGVCDVNLNFVYVLSGWEGSAADGRVLRDAIYRPNGFRVRKGNYYLCDAGYTNGEGFLAPYRGIRYHLSEWEAGTNRPQNARELFNMRHSKARNTIERAFGILKTRWAILRSMSFYPIETQNKIILACCLIHNFIRTEMVVDPIEHLVPEIVPNDCDDNVQTIDHVQTTPQWTAMRDELAENMYNEWRQPRNRRTN